MINERGMKSYLISTFFIRVGLAHVRGGGVVVSRLVYGNWLFP
jgi:hypothetical protein